MKNTQKADNQGNYYRTKNEETESNKFNRLCEAVQIEAKRIPIPLFKPRYIMRKTLHVGWSQKENMHTQMLVKLAFLSETPKSIPETKIMT